VPPTNPGSKALKKFTDTLIKIKAQTELPR